MVNVIIPRSELCCELCGRVTKRGTTAHHLIPRTCHANRWFKKNFSREDLRRTIQVCRDCHQAIHDLIPNEKQLGRHFNTIEKLRSHAALNEFLNWVRKRR